MKRPLDWPMKILSILLTGVMGCTLLFTGCSDSGKKNENNKNEVVLPEATLPYQRASFHIKNDWTANWIWAKKDANGPNSWVSFRKKISISKENLEEGATAYIAAESKYWLYINGEIAVREGGLKRGPTPNDGYYDKIDITKYLNEGENTISVLVWFWRDGTSYSSSNSGKGGFLFESEIGSIKVISDNTWRATRNTAFLEDTGAQQPNYRLPEANIYYDARKELTDWMKPDYDDSAWHNAKELGKGGCAPWNQLYERPIPFLKDFGLKDYENSAKYENYSVHKKENITVTIPYNAQLTPYLEVESDAGKEICITTENSSIGSVISTYVTKDGRQAFESPGWFNGERITYSVPKGIKIISLKYRETGYDSEFSGNFSCSDEFLNRLWIKSLRTLYVTMRDNFMDCPDRERAQWWGDVTNEMAMTMYALDTNSYLLYQKGVYNMLAYTDPNTKVLQTVVPIRNDYFELPMQQLAGVCGFETYYMYTGDDQFIKDVYSYAKDYIDLWSIGQDGLVNHRPGSWDWADWGSDFDVPPLENAWYYKALNSVIHMAEIAGKEEDISAMQTKADALYAAYEQLWTEKGYKSSAVTRADDRANALAVLSGLAAPDKYEVILKNLTSVKNASPYMERYVLDALCEMGYMTEAQERIHDRYKDMVDYDYSTLWEFWDHGGTLNHAWSGGPLLTMSQYMAGIEPIDAGYAKYSVKPMLGKLSSLECTVPSVKGYIHVNVQSDKERFRMALKSPADTAVVIGIPRQEDKSSLGANMAVKYNESIIYEHGTSCIPDHLANILSFYGSDSQYLYFSLESGGQPVECTFEAFLTAEQDKTEYTLEIIVSENGSVVSEGETFGSGTHTVTVSKDREIKLQAVAGTQAYFTGWSGSTGSKEKNITLKPQCDMKISANFCKKMNTFGRVTFIAEAGCDIIIQTEDGRKLSLDKGTRTILLPDGELAKFTVADGILFHFMGFEGAVKSTDKAISVQINGNMEIRVKADKSLSENVALGAAASASDSLETGTWSAGNLTDGSLEKGFTSNVLTPYDGGKISPVSVVLQLKDTKDFSIIALAPRTDVTDSGGGSPNYPREFTVSVSNDGVYFRAVKTFTDEDNPLGAVRLYEFEEQMAAYVKIEFSRSGTYAADEGVADPYRIQLMEIMLYNAK